MAKLLLVSILMIFVYQFDELARGALRIISRFRHKKFKIISLELESLDSDRYVGAALTIFSMPMVLGFLITSTRSLEFNLAVVAGMLLGFGLLGLCVSSAQARLKEALYFNNVGSVAAAAYAIAGFFHPMSRNIPWMGGKDLKLFIRLALLLSLPALAGLGFKWYYGPSSYENELGRYMDILIIVMVGGLFIHITTPILRKFLHHSNLNLGGYVRVLVGIGLSLAIFW